MGYRELIESLREEGEEQINRIREEAGAEAEKIKAGLSARLAGIKEEHKKTLLRTAESQGKSIISEAESGARTTRLEAEGALSERLFSLAVSCLHRLRNENYNDVFGRLANELPKGQWTEVRVNPGDTETTRKYFPESTVIPVQKITGGMDVTSRDGRLRIINTFEKRLEMIWQELLPLLIRDIYNEVSGYGTPSKS